MAALLVGLLHSPGRCVCGCEGFWVRGFLWVDGWVEGVHIDGWLVGVHTDR